MPLATTVTSSTDYCTRVIIQNRPDITMSFALGGVEAQISRMNLSPTNSPNSRRQAAANDALFNISVTAVPQDRDQRFNNTTPQRQEPQLLAPVSYVSPRHPPAPPAFVRAHSSPSIIDTSPKMKGQKRLEPSPTCVAEPPEFPTVGSPPQAIRSLSGTNPISELTPVASNMARETCSISLNDDVSARRDLEQLSVPQAQALVSDANRHSSHGSLESRRLTHTPSRIHPRNDHFHREEQEDGPNDLDLGPISSVSWVQQGSSIRGVANNRTLASQIPTRGGVTHGHGLQDLNHPHTHNHSTGILQSRNPHNRTPYQPTRESRLSSFGIVRDDAESIFHSNVDSSCRSGQQTSETHDVDDTDYSVPSLRLATQLRSNTYDSFTTISGDDLDSLMMEEDSVMMVGSTTSYEEPQWGCFANMSMASVLVPGTSVPSSASYSRSGTRSKVLVEDRRPRRRSSRVMSPEKEREVFDWLHSLEVDKDNNEFVAEAASSKFLRGKFNMEDEYISVPEPQVIPRGVPIMTSQRKAPMGHKVEMPAPGKSHVVPNKGAKPVANAPPTASNNALSKRVKPAALGLGSIAEYCGKERRLIVQSQCKRRKKRPVLRSCSGM